MGLVSRDVRMALRVQSSPRSAGQIIRPSTQPMTSAASTATTTSDTLFMGQEAKQQMRVAKIRTLMHCLPCGTLHYIVINKSLTLIIKQEMKKMIRRMI